LIAVGGENGYQARLTFAMARHAAVDLGLVFHTSPLNLEIDRLSPANVEALRELLQSAGTELSHGETFAKALTDLRALYEPFVNALAVYFQFVLPPFLPTKQPVDNWQTSAWMQR
jgi:hypothetical protein